MLNRAQIRSQSFTLGLARINGRPKGLAIVLLDLRLNCLAKQNQFQFQTKRFEGITQRCMPDVTSDWSLSPKNCSKWSAIGADLIGSVFADCHWHCLKRSKSVHGNDRWKWFIMKSRRRRALRKSIHLFL